VRQVVADQHPLAVAGHSGVARIETGADLGDHHQMVEVIFADPAVARGEIDEAAVRRKLRSAVQRIAAGKAVQALETVAVEERDMMVAGFDDDEQIQRVGTLERRAPAWPAALRR
jgi:hypothetical protein